MNKKAISVKNMHVADFSYAGDPAFILPSPRENTAPHEAPASTQKSDLKPLLEKLLNTLLLAVNASAGIIRVLPPHNQNMQVIGSVGLPVELMESTPDLPCETCATSWHGIYSADISSCGSREDCRYARCQFQSMLVATLENSPANPVGKLTLFFNHQADAHTSNTVMSFAHLIGSVIEHNKSNRDAKRVDLMAERQSIGNEIHDSLAQTLAYTRMRASLLLESLRTGNSLMSAKYAHDIDEALEISQKTVRELITDFRCAMDPSGLLHALQTLNEQFCQRNEIELDYINNVAHLELPLEYEIQVLHIVQEALANIATHSGATHARLSVDFSDNAYLFMIEDNGSGGDTFTPVEGHYGMMIMRERAQRIGGEIKVESFKGTGTRVQLLLPEPGADWRTVNE